MRPVLIFVPPAETGLSIIKKDHSLLEFGKCCLPSVGRGVSVAFVVGAAVVTVVAAVVGTKIKWEVSSGNMLR